MRHAISFGSLLWRRSSVLPLFPGRLVPGDVPARPALGHVAGDEAHDEVGHPGAPPELEDAADAGVIETGEDPGLALEAALELANQGHQVTLVEKQASIGGIMAQLDKTYPTMDCSI